MIATDLDPNQHVLQATLITLFSALIALIYLSLSPIIFLIATADCLKFRIHRWRHGTPPSNAFSDY
jgi:hypothetical protein